MKKGIVFCSMEHIDSDLVDEAETYKRAKKKNTWVKWTSIAACLALMILCAGIMIPKLSTQVDPNEEVVFHLPDDIDKIIWGDGTQSPENPDAWTEWHGWHLDWQLETVLSQQTDDLFIAILVSKDYQTDINQFKYNGKTVADIRAEIDDLQKQELDLGQFQKDGEVLKYGELLYTTGTPEGEKWTKELYDNTVAQYGEDFISKYIINGVVQHEKLIEDAALCRDKVDQLYLELNEAFSAYNKSYGESIKKEFDKNGVSSVLKDGKLIIFVKKDELAKLKINNKDDFTLYLAKKSYYDDSVDQTDVSEPDNEEPIELPE